MSFPFPVIHVVDWSYFMKILVIDDDESILALIERILSKTDRIEVAVAASAASALELISANDTPFDCLLIDIQMPQINGIALTRLVRETPGYETVPILMLTAMHAKGYLDEAFAAGATDYVTKPFDFADLTRRIREAKLACLKKSPSDAAQADETVGEDGERLSLGTAFALRNTSEAVEDREFENYVLQLGRTRVSRLGGFAVKIDDVEGLFAAMPTCAFRALIDRVAKGIAEILLGTNGVMTYRGTGVFLCVDEDGVRRLPGGARERLSGWMDRTRPAEEDLPVRLLVGARVPVDTSTSFDAIASLSRAIAAADDLDMPRPGLFGLSNRIFGRRHVGLEKKRLDQRVFKTMLDEALPSLNARALERNGRRRERN